MNLLLFSIYTKKLIVTVNVYHEKQLLNDGNILLTAHKKMGKLYWTLYLWNPIFLFFNFTQFWKIHSSHRFMCTQEYYVVLSLYGILPITYLQNSLIPADINIAGMLLLSLIIWKTWLTWCVSVFIAAQHQQGNNAQVILGREYDAWPLFSSLSLSSSALKYVSEGPKGISCKSVCIRQHIHALLCCFGTSFHPLGTCFQ